LFDSEDNSSPEDCSGIKFCKHSEGEGILKIESSTDLLISRQLKSTNARRIIFPTLHNQIFEPHTRLLKENTDRNSALTFKDIETKQCQSCDYSELDTLCDCKGTKQFSRTSTDIESHQYSDCPLSSRLCRLFAASSELSSLPVALEMDDLPSNMHHSTKSILREKTLECENCASHLPCKHVHFNPRVSVLEFDRSIEEAKLLWYSASELKSFRCQSMEQYVPLQLFPARSKHSLQKSAMQAFGLFSSPRTFANDREFKLQTIFQSELKNILVVDPHELCSKLFAKGLKNMAPFANVVIAKTSDEALTLVKAVHNFDFILVEERLKIIQESLKYKSSGSDLICLLKKKFQCTLPEARQPIFVGVSAHFQKDKDKIKRSGAAFCWPKPPPSLDKAMRNSLLKHILINRGKGEVAINFFS
jgi:hypothetical protein